MTEGLRGEMKARVIALYLPQFHPIPENDEMWGKGFTEWRNVALAKPMFRGHFQPKIPADLGFYDLRLPEVREAQAAMAAAHGIEGFCYYHYWFSGKRLLEMPFNEALRTGRPDFPFCLCWANESWSGVWVGRPDHIIMEQRYLGPEEDERHFYDLLPAFRDPRYIRVDGKPIFFIYRPAKLPDSNATIALWRDLAAREGLPGLFLVGINHRIALWEPGPAGFDAALVNRLPDTRPWVSRRDPLRWLRFKMQASRRQPTVYDYSEDLVQPIYDEVRTGQWFPTVYPNWDTSARHRERGLVMHDATPEKFEGVMRKAVHLVAQRAPQHRIIILKSWNEWAEGNYVEPDLRHGDGYLKAVQRSVIPT